MVRGRWLPALVRLTANNRFPRLSAHKRPGDKANVMATTSQHGEESKEKSGCSVDESSQEVSESPLLSSTTDYSTEQSVAAVVDDKAWCSSGGSEIATVLLSTTSGVPEGMTKTQWKKQLRQQRRVLKWERSKMLKKEKKAAERERRLKERELTEKEGKPWPVKRKRLDKDVATLPRTTFKKMSSSDASPIRVAIDFGFEELMTDKDIKMLVKQCQRCYSQNRRAEAPLQVCSNDSPHACATSIQLYWTNFGGRSKERLDAIMSYKNWDVHVRGHGYIEEFGKDSVVFLTSDSPNILMELDPSKAYIIGGLVDHNHYKGYCFKHAVQQGIAHAQLPISEYVKLNCRTVLAINHVFEILLAFSQNKDWKKSFYQVIPQRKVDKSDEAGGLHQFTADTNELEDQPFSLQYETSCDYETEGAVTHHSLMEVQRESKESKIIDSNRNIEDNSDSDRGISEGSATP